MIRRAVREDTGDVLVFLPGAGEINAVAARLADLGGIDVLTLHGRQGAAAHDDVLRPAGRRRVVLATAVAESSLTVPGVRVVVDAGLSRVPRTDHARGLGSLVTVRSSRATATQRAGRAGRQAPGRVYRCWSEAEHERRPAYTEPEVASADLTAFVLHLACWGDTDGTGLALLDPPPAAATQVARTTLTALGALDGTGRVTARGRAIAAVGAHPRLARALLDASPTVGTRRAADIVAVLSADLPTGTDDLPAQLRRLRAGTDPAATAVWRAEARRLSRAVTGPAHGAVPDDLAAGLIVGLAYPERVARRRTRDANSYLMTGGTAADLGPGTALHGVQWLAIAEADRQPGQAAARIRLAAPVDADTARLAADALYTDVEEVMWDNGDVTARRSTRLGAIVLTDRDLTDPDRQLVAAALAEGLRREGLSLLRWTPDATALRQRLSFLHHTLGEPLARGRRRSAAGRSPPMARRGHGLGPPARRPGPPRRRCRVAPVAALAPGRTARRVRPRAVAGAQRVAGASGLHRSGRAGASGQDPGGVRLDPHADDRRWTCPGGAAPALARRAARGRDQRSGLVLAQRLSTGTGTASRPVSATSLA